MVELSWQQRLRNAIFRIKFSQMPGVHNNGVYERDLTVSEALDQLAEEMGVREVANPKELYWVEDARLYSRISSRCYPVVYDGQKVKVQYDGEWYDCVSERAAMNFINMKELKEPPNNESVIEGYFKYQGEGIEYG